MKKHSKNSSRRLNRTKTKNRLNFYNLLSELLVNNEYGFLLTPS